MAKSLFKPFPRNQLATKAQSFPRKSSNTARVPHDSSPRQRFFMKSRVEFKFPTPWKTLMIKFPPPRDGKGVKCPGYARGGAC